MGVKVSEADDVLIDGKPLKAKPKLVYIAYNKPVGITCTTERKIQSNIVKAVNYPERIFPIGRLDRPSEARSSRFPRCQRLPPFRRNSQGISRNFIDNASGRLP